MDSFFSTPSSSFVEEVCCEVCLEPFRPLIRPPKLLPCGHNFCEQCLFSIYCHQQYYLLDSITCPTCRCSFPANSAISAPTNFDLCKMLESGSRAHEVTVIRKEEEGRRDRGYVLNASISSKKSRKDSSVRCFDCHRHLNEKSISRSARACVKCNTGLYLSLSCLECCVDRHNGHELIPRTQVENEQNRAAEEQKRLLEMANEMARIVEKGKAFSSPLCRLSTTQHSTIRDALSDLEAGLRLLLSPRLLSPQAIHSIRRTACQHVGKVSTVMKVVDNEYTMTIDRNKLSGSKLRQSRLRLRDSDSLARESLASVLSVLPSSSTYYTQIASLISSISSKDSIEERLKIYLDASSVLTQALSPSLSSTSLPVVADAFIHMFHEMGELSKKRIGSTSLAGKSRTTIWKHIQMAYSELLREVSKRFDFHHPGRMDVLDDLSFCCRIYADVADQASLTLCMIEAARARAADADTERLKVIDENLLECRRQQKLNALRQRTERRNVVVRMFTTCVKGTRNEE